MSNQLLPCPFCGHDEPTHDEGDDSAWVQCTNGECGMCGPMASGPSLAAAAWNRRATQPAAGEPEQQTAINADDLPTKKYPLGAFDFDAPVAAGEPVAWIVESPQGCEHVKSVCDSKLLADRYESLGWAVTAVFAAPPAAAHGDEAVAIVSRYFIDPWYDQSGQGGGWRHEVKLLTDLPDGTKLYAMRAKAGEGGVV